MFDSHALKEGEGQSIRKTNCDLHPRAELEKAEKYKWGIEKRKKK